MGKTKELLNNFYQNKKYDDEEFKFLKYPDVNKYEYVISNYGRLFKFIDGKEKKVHEDKDGYYMTSIRVTRKGGTTVKNKFGRRICDKVRALKKTGLTFND